MREIGGGLLCAVGVILIADITGIRRKPRQPAGGRDGTALKGVTDEKMEGEREL